MSKIPYINTAEVTYTNILTLSAEDLNKADPTAFIGFSLNQLKACLEHGLDIKNLIPALPELFKAADSKTELLTFLANSGLELEVFANDATPQSIYQHLDTASMQQLIDNGISADDMAKQIFIAMIHLDKNNQDAFKIQLHFLANKGLNLSQIYEFSQLPISIVYDHRDILTTDQSATDILKFAFKSYAYDDNAKRMKTELIKEALDKGAKLNHFIQNEIYNFTFQLDFLYNIKDMLLNNPSDPLSATNFLNLVTCASTHLESAVKIQGELIKEALDRGADINCKIIYYPSLECLSAHKDMLLNHPTNPLSASNLLKFALAAYIKNFTYSQNTNQYENDPQKIKIQSELIEIALNMGADINNIDYNDYHRALTLELLVTHKDILLNHPTNHLTMSAFLEILSSTIEKETDLNLHYQSAPSLENDNYLFELLKEAVEKGADLNAKLTSDEVNYTLFEQLLVNNRFAALDFVKDLTPHVNYSISTMAWLQTLGGRPNIEHITQALQRFPDSFSKEEASDLLRAHGISHSLINGLFDIYDLASDVFKATTGQDTSVLSETELRLLGPIKYNITAVECMNGEYKNSYGFSPLSLALLGDRIELATQLINNGFSLTEKNKNGVTPIQIIGKIADGRSIDSELSSAIFNNLINFDVILNELGESLVDNFLSHDAFKDKILEKTNDPLFSFYKPNADLYSPSLHPDKVHIAISMGEGFWSTGLNAAARLISQDHPEVSFYLVTFEMMEKGGDKFVGQFNGWINPGAGDSFPNDKAEFNKNDWAQSMVLEQTYQAALAKTYELKIPYMGMCAGAQNFVLHHDGYIYPLDGYSKGQHTVTYIKGTLSHFMTMTPDQQKLALQECEFPEVIFKGDTAHHYAAVAHKLGNGIQLGAISEDGVAMSYAHENGLRYATQFHPEHFYHMHTDKNDNVNHQRIWLENFIHLTQLHSKHIVDGDTHPEAIWAYISDRLSECLKAPVCLEDGAFSNSTMAQILLN